MGFMSMTINLIFKKLKNKIIQLIEHLITLYIFKYKSNYSYHKIAESEEIKNKIYQLRYAIYHVEFSRDVAGVDHQLKIIKDELDDDPNTFLFYLEENHKIIATLRATIWQAGKTSLPDE